MRPGDYPLTLYRGDSYSWRFDLYANSTGTPADLTGVTAKAEIRDVPGGQVLAAMLCTITQPNQVLMKLLTSQWTTLIRKSGFWDLQLTYADADASVVTVLAGAVAITPDVTDSQVISDIVKLERTRV